MGRPVNKRSRAGLAGGIAQSNWCALGESNPSFQVENLAS